MVEQLRRLDHPVVVEEDEIRVEPHDLLDRVWQVLKRNVEQPLLLPQGVTSRGASMDEDIAVGGLPLLLL